MKEYSNGYTTHSNDGSSGPKLSKDRNFANEGSIDINIIQNYTMNKYKTLWARISR